MGIINCACQCGWRPHIARALVYAYLRARVCVCMYYFKTQKEPVAEGEGLREKRSERWSGAVASGPIIHISPCHFSVRRRSHLLSCRSVSTARADRPTDSVLGSAHRPDSRVKRRCERVRENYCYYYYFIYYCKRTYIYIYMCVCIYYIYWKIRARLVVDGRERSHLLCWFIIRKSVPGARARETLSENATVNFPGNEEYFGNTSREHFF